MVVGTVLSTDRQRVQEPWIASVTACVLVSDSNRRISTTGSRARAPGIAVAPVRWISTVGARDSDPASGLPGSDNREHDAARNPPWARRRIRSHGCRLDPTMFGSLASLPTVGA